MANEVVIRIRGDNADAKAKIDEVKQHAHGIGAAFTAAFKVAAAGAAIGIGAMTASVKAAIDFESSFAGVRKTVDATEAQFKDLEKGIRQMAKTVPVGTTELNKLAESAGQLGIKRENILQFTETVAAMGVATNLSGTDAATALARLINITGDSQESISNVGSAIVALGNTSATTESEIVSMALRLAGAGHTAGVSTPDILGLAAALSSVGIEADAGGTAFSRVMIEMFEATQKGGTELQAFAETAGVSTAQFKKQFKEDAAGAINAFVVGLAKAHNAGTNIFPILEKLGLNEIRVRDALLRTAGAQDLVNKSLETSRKAYGDNLALTEEATKRYQTTESQLQILHNRLSDVGIIIGSVLLPPLNDLIKKFADGLTVIASWVEKITEGGDAAKDAGELIKTMLGKALDWIKDQVPVVADAMGRWATRMRDWVIDSIPGLLSNALQFLSSLLDWISDNAPTLAQKLIGEWVPSAIEWVGEAAVRIIQELPGWIIQIGKWLITDGIPKFIEIGDKMGAAIGQGFKQAIERWGPSIGEWITKYLSPGGAIQAAIDMALGSGRKGSASLQGMAGSLGLSSIDMMSPLGSLTAAGFDQFSMTLRGFMQQIAAEEQDARNRAAADSAANIARSQQQNWWSAVQREGQSFFGTLLSQGEMEQVLSNFVRSPWEGNTDLASLPLLQQLIEGFRQTGDITFPQFASGGVVPGQIGSPQLAVVHGGETISPYGSGGGVVLNFYGPIYGMPDFEAQVGSAVTNLRRRGGLAGVFNG